MKNWKEYSETELREIIERKHCQEKLSLRVIAKELGTYAVRVLRFCRKHNIPTLSSSESLKAGYQDNRIKSAMKGKKLDEEVKAKISERLHKKWKSLTPKEKKERSEKQRQIFAARTDKDSFSAQGCRAIRNAAKVGSKLELALKKYFDENNISYHHHYTDLLPHTKLEADFYLPAHNLVIEVDGPSHFFSNFSDQNYQSQIRADEKKNGLILGIGLSILRIQHKRTLYKRDHRNIIEYLAENLDTFNNEVRRVDVDSL